MVALTTFIRAWVLPAIVLFVAGLARADLPIYANGDLHVWTDPTTLITRSWGENSWNGVSVDRYNPSPVQSGAGSIALTFDCAWCALSFYASSPLDKTGVQALRFWVHGGVEGGQRDLKARVCESVAGKDPLICAEQSFVPTANQWNQVEVSLAGFTGANIGSVTWNNWSGTKKPATLYLDEIVLVGASGGDGTVPLFTDFKSPNWNFWNTNTGTEVVASPVHSGAAALAIHSQAGWNTLQLGHINFAENIAGFYTLRFWIHGGVGGPGGVAQKVTFSAVNGQGYPTIPQEVTAPANTWTQVEIPLADLGDPLSIYLLRWWNPSENVMPTWYLDDIVLAPGPGPANQAAVDISVVYDDAVPRRWNTVSNQGTSDPIAVDLASTTAIHGGTAAIQVANLRNGHLFAFTGAGDQPLDIPGYDTLRFFIHGGQSGGQQVTVEVLNGNMVATQKQVITAQAGTWTQVDVPLSSQLHPLNVGIIRFLNESGATLETFHLDDIGFVASGGTPPPSTGTGPALGVDTSRDRRPISPYIYGMANPDPALFQELSLPMSRWGGNQTTTYNWRIDTYNTGFDWYFENISQSSPESLPNGSSVNQFIERSLAAGTKPLITMPMIGWVSKRWMGTHPYDCAYKQSVYGEQRSADYQYDPDCGNGILLDGTPITWNNPADVATPAGPEFVRDWVTYLVGRYGTAAQGGVPFYALDNEPMLWNSSHSHLFKHPLSADELRDLAYAYGPVIKAADPSAKIFGPVFWGWCAYFYSAVDNCTNNGTVDYEAHGSIPLVAWYLQQMQAYEQQHGVRILDYLDLHAYPNALGVYTSEVGNRTTQALRLRSTRQLWDPDYQDESWVPAKIQLIPRMRAWVDENYPGTKLALTEYNWGAWSYMNGALAQADVLGIFGREGLDVATLWDFPRPRTTDPLVMAFRMYRNYDGAGGRFGETSVHAESADQDEIAIYAAEQGARLTLMIVNKSTQQLSSPVTLAGFAPAPTARVYRYSSAHLAGIVREADQAMSETGFTGVFPASSITLVVLERASGPALSPLAVARAGAGQGRITSNPNGIDCGDQCSFDFPAEASVTLTATPSPGSVFSGWSGGCSGTGGCGVTPGAGQSVTATFDPAPIDLTITGYTQLSRVRVNSYDYQYVYRVNASNQGGAGAGVTGTLQAPYPQGMTPVDSTLTLGNMAHGASAGDTISFRQDRRYPLRTQDLIWSFAPH